MNSDIHQNVALLPDQLEWKNTDSPGVEQALLDKVTWESSYLRIQKNSPLPQSDDSEEYLILSGSLKSSDQTFSAGDYLRYPSGHERTLSSGSEGALVFRKKGHFESNDTTSLTASANSNQWRQGMVAGLSVMPLHSHHHESIAFVKWAPNTQFNPHIHPGGEEIIVLEGTFHDEHGSYPTGSWLRNKPYSQHTPHTEDDGALIYVKTGHLPPLTQS